jgi:DNA-binding transcriptional LysR family regulator
MEIQELKVLTTIIDTGGFNLAAKKLGLTQPAVSQSLSNLERKLGQQLLNRNTPVTPTALGLELLKHARFVLESEASFLDQLTRLKQGHLQNLTIAVDHLAATYYCPSLIAEFHKVLPEANIKIRRMPAREIIHAVKSEQYLIGFGPFQKSMDGFYTKRLLSEESLLVTGKRNKNIKLYHRDPLEFLKVTPLLASYLDEASDRPSKKKIRDFFKSVWEINDINLQMNLIKQGIGATFVAKSFLENRPKGHGMMTLDQLPFGQIKKQYGLYILKKNKQDPMVSQVMEYEFF